MIHRQFERLVEEPVSHNPRVRKRVWLRNGEVPPFTQLARAVFPPGEVCGIHAHADMGEIFIVEKGTAEIVVDAVPVELQEGACIVVGRGEHHEVANRSDTELVLLTLGWKETPKKETNA